MEDAYKQDNYTKELLKHKHLNSKGLLEKEVHRSKRVIIPNN